MALQIHSAASAAQLVDELTRQLSVRHADPFGRDVVVVPSSGMREYLIEHLCRSLPVERASGPLLANVEFIYPNEFNMRVLGHRRSSDDPWKASRLRWALLDELERDPDLLPGYRDARRRLGRAEKAAMLFEKYSAQRPAMLVDWAAGSCTDGFGPLDETRLASYGWQYTLWRRVREHLGASHAEELRTRTPKVEPGVRYWLFALEFFSPAKIALLSQLGDAAVGVFMLQAPAAKETELLLGATAGHAVARSKFTHDDFDNPLNRSWASIAHETDAMVAALAAAVGATVQRAHLSAPPTLLGRLQQAITTDDAAPPVAEPAPHDHSLQVHLCHGATRQVQVLRDALLHLFNADPTLHPRDVLVHCLDLDTFAPLLAPLLGAGGHPVPVTIVDRSVTTRTEFEIAIESLVTVLEQRCTLDDFRDLLSHAVIRDSVGLSADEVTLFDDLLPSLDVRWGLDAAQRERWGYPADDDVSTLRHALDRVLLGALLQGAEGHEVLPGVTPVGDVDGQTAVAAGKVSTLVSTLQSTARRCADTQTVGEWALTLRSILTDLVRLERDHDWMSDNLEALASEMSTAALDRPTLTLAPVEFFAQVRAALSGVAGRSRQWADAVRVATPETLRGVPARVVVMLGMDEHRMRKGGLDGDDLLVVTPHVGDRDPRSEHRLGLLTALCSASDAVVVLADGHSVTDNAPIPPAMPVRELIDHAAAICGRPADGALPFVVHHARQATDVVNLGVASDDKGKDVGAFVDGPFTFDATAITIANKVRASAGVVGEIALPDVLPPPSPHELVLDLSIRDLDRSIGRPTEVYFENRLRVRLPDEESSNDDELELWPEGLDRHALGAGLLEAALAGGDLNEWWATRRLDGGVPPGQLGSMVHADIATIAEAIAALAKITGVQAQSHSVRVSIPGTDFTLDDVVHTVDGVVTFTTFSEWHAGMRLKALLPLAALTLHEPDVAWSARVVARGPKPDDNVKTPPPVAVVEAFALAGATADARTHSATKVLRFAIDARRRALRSPLMAFERASWLLGVSAPTNIKSAMSYDMRGAYFRWLFPDIDPKQFDVTYRAVLSVLSGELESDLPGSDPRAAMRYAIALRSMWDDCVVVSESTVKLPPLKRVDPATGKAM